MLATLTGLCFFAFSAQPVQTKFVQVAPLVKLPGEPVRSPGQERAVVLIHGLWIHPFSKENVERATLRSWQRPDSLLVKRLAADSDVFAFAYGQNDALDEIGDLPDLDASVRRLHRMGYKSVVLVGHSAGGLLARHCAEDHPDAGISKVIQVCAPNTGSWWAHVHAVRRNQIGFLESLTKEVRSRAADGRADRQIPKETEFACLVGNGAFGGDCIVSCRSQWPEDLQKQGIPAFPLPTTHWSATRGKKGIEKIAELVREPLPRWSAERVATVRKQIWKD
jgi:pimeloyl-ACP methyl ester carboxylesterase